MGALENTHTPANNTISVLGKIEVGMIEACRIIHIGSSFRTLNNVNSYQYATVKAMFHANNTVNMCKLPITKYKIMSHNSQHNTEQINPPTTIVYTACPCN